MRIRPHFLPPLLLVAACSGDPSPELRDLGAIGSQESPASDPILQVQGNSIRLLYQSLNGWATRNWEPGGLGDTAILDENPTGPLIYGMLQVDPLEYPRGSSPRLRNGTLRRGDQLEGWSPSVALDSRGSLHLVFDRAVDGNFDVIYRSPPSGDLLVDAVVGGGPAFQAHASIAVDRNDAVWIAWDEGADDWGQGLGLHHERVVRVVGLHDGVVPAPAPPLPAALLDIVTHPAAGLAPDSNAVVLAELPRLVADEAGPLWLFVRVMQAYPSNEDRDAARRVAWSIRALALTDEGWSQPVTLPGSDGPNHDTLALAPLAGGGVAAVYESDNRVAHFATVERWGEPVMSAPSLHAVELRLNGKTPSLGPPQGRATLRPASPAPPTGLTDPDPSLVPEGFVRLWGDLHRHSDLSRCKMDVDGSVPDQYRYARDVAGLDFLALTDHFQHISSTQWDFLRRNTARCNEPGRFTALYGFERTAMGGHRNLICIDPRKAATAPFIPFDREKPWDGFDPADWIAIPHQLADRFALLDWREPKPEIERLAEIYQGRRGSYESKNAERRDFGSHEEANHAIEFLNNGRRFGFVASSDHISTSRSYAAVYARENSQEAVFAALRARRTYAATAPIALDVRLGGLLMGSAGAAEASTPLTVRVDGGGSLARVEVVRNGRWVKRWTGTEAGQGILTVRLGRVDARRRIRIELENGSLGRPVPFVCEGGDRIVESTETTLVFDADLTITDDDAVILPCTFGPETRLRYRMGDTEETIPMDDIRAGTPKWLRLEKTRLEFRLDPPALGAEQFTEEWAPGDWKPGDWVYVRVVRTDGEMAWSSPIWVQ